MAQERSEFVNESSGYCGAVVLEKGEPKGISVEPGAAVWLTEEEQILTANAPARDEDNPFTNGTLKLKTPATEIANRRPIGDPGNAPNPDVPNPEEAEQARQRAEAAAAERREEAERNRQAEQDRLERGQKQAAQPATPVEETGAAVSPSGTPEVGKRAEAEEVATPEAPARSG